MCERGSARENLRVISDIRFQQRARRALREGLRARPRPADSSWTARRCTRPSSARCEPTRAREHEGSTPPRPSPVTRRPKHLSSFLPPLSFSSTQRDDLVRPPTEPRRPRPIPLPAHRTLAELVVVVQRPGQDLGHQGGGRGEEEGALRRARSRGGEATRAGWGRGVGRRRRPVARRSRAERRCGGRRRRALAAGAGGSSADDMRRQILAERERRRAAMLKEKEERERALAAEDEDPAMAPLNDAVARVAAHADAEASAGLLLRIVGNALNNPGSPSTEGFDSQTRKSLPRCSTPTGVSSSSSARGSGSCSRTTAARAIRA